PTKPLPEAGFVSSVGSSSHEFQIFQPIQAEKPYQCDRCGTRFDTSIGRAWHEANDCGDVSRERYENAALPSCLKCGSYALERLGNGTSDCQSCGANFQTARKFGG